MRRAPRLRLALLALAALALPSGLWAGLSRLGWALPHGSSLPALHAPLPISGMFGTLISLERAAALQRTWPYSAPALSALATLVLLVGGPVELGAGRQASGLVTLIALLAFALCIARAARHAGRQIATANLVAPRHTLTRRR